MLKIHKIIRFINNVKENEEDDCNCELEDELSLAEDKIEKIDREIREIFYDARKYKPTAKERKSFLESVKENSQTCHAIIDELRNQRIEINYMLKSFNKIAVKFLEIEKCLRQQYTKIKKTESTLLWMESIVTYLKNRIAIQRKNFEKEKRTMRLLDKKNEKLLEYNVAWIKELNSERSGNRKSEISLRDLRKCEGITNHTVFVSAMNQLLKTIYKQKLNSLHKSVSKFKLLALIKRNFLRKSSRKKQTYFKQLERLFISQLNSVPHDYKVRRD